jgi:hypothetical protein
MNTWLFVIAKVGFLVDNKYAVNPYNMGIMTLRVWFDITWI